ncbi:MAG: hypothetical protein JO051_16555 [Acidobacteriaceae bacterium]|nr:hypothetical protein [Acidobacteriaceae bacterium]
MYLFHFLRSFLPLRNPIGFGVSDFVEFAITLLLVGLLFGWAWTGGWFRTLAMHARACIVLIGLLPIVLRLFLLPHCPAPVPAGADDFGYILLGDTLAHFRLANPPHALSQFFEAVFVLQQPTYSSIFPLGQGLFLAFGRLLFGSFWAGVLISTSLLCASCYWMLRGWLSPQWALLGGFVAVMEFGPLCQWTNSYWGGNVSAVAGCLVFGALPRLRFGAWLAWLALGFGFALELLTRPFEFWLLLASVALYLAWVQRVGVSRGTRRRVAVAGAILLAAVLLSAAQNKAVTGSWTTLPYALSRYQYGVPTTLTFQANPAPHRALTAEQELDYSAQAAVHGDSNESAGAFLSRLGFRVRYYRFFLVAPLYVAVVAFLVTARTRRDWWIVAAVAMFALGTNLYPYFYPQYVAAEACLFVLIAVRGLERICDWKPQIGRLVVLFCGVQFFFWYGLHALAGENLWDAFHYEAGDFVNYGDPEGRIAVQEKLNAEPGQQLVFVRYWAGHEFREWVHNAADIDGARVVWALDLGDAENAKLLSYYPKRRAWLLEPDARPVRLTAYSGE